MTLPSHITIDTVLSWKPEAIVDSATKVEQAASKLIAQAKTIESTSHEISDWKGRAGDLAREQIQNRYHNGLALSRSLDAVSETLKRGAQEISSAKMGLQSIKLQAEAEGFKVHGNGEVSWESKPLSSADGDSLTPGQRQQQADLERHRNHMRAMRLQSDIQGQVQLAAEADKRLSSKLVALDLPRSLLLSEDVLARAIKQGIKITKTALGLRKKFKNLKAKSKALKQFFKNFKTISKNRELFKSILKEMRAGKKLIDNADEVAKTMEKIIKPFFPKIPGVVSKADKLLRASGKFAGVVGAGLNVYSGLKDMYDGGGYSGARGTVTKVMGGVGVASGLGVLLCSNPVGWGIAATGATAYALWGIGNTIYDHKDQIAAAASKAGKAIGNAFPAVPEFFKNAGRYAAGPMTVPLR
ncbi:hypothetical protein KEM60_03303 [Austwickia sp. TVS 96-490-7B]|uniref:WXG100 family type VII secretion target n=1 Tax=Austwickia sp. TVS 96-490-7B TaxID=2830843 RepID=UPI001C565082|nr:hypothetical protein [Austwickia sp. TVS 96-490-7B]MBW3087073.1 hypothetical protein [Austwickia sp. TVS 96-490-7B]